MKQGLLIVSLIACALAAQAQETLQFYATATGADEVPTNNDPSVATGYFTLDGNSLSFFVNVPAETFIPYHTYIQGPALPGTNAPIIFDLGGPTFQGGNDFGGQASYRFFSPFDGTFGAGPFNLTGAQINDLENGLWYLNATSYELTNGQLRGQIFPAPVGLLQFNATLTGADEVPPNSDPTVATGSFSLGGNYLSFSLNVPLVSFITEHAYIQGPALPGTNAPVIFDLGLPSVQNGNPLFETPPFYVFGVPIDGYLTAGPFYLTSPQIHDLQSGLWYVNVTSYELPNGQLRGQIVALPVFMAQPQNQTVYQGSNATFAASAVGIPNPTYQWQFDSADIPFATNSAYSIVAVQTTNAGTYAVVASNSSGSVTSAVVTLNVVVNQATLSGPLLTNNTFQFTVSEVSSLNYIIQENTDLSTTNWISVATNTAPFTFTDTAFSSNPGRFYRAIYQP